MDSKIPCRSSPTSDKWMFVSVICFSIHHHPHSDSFVKPAALGSCRKCRYCNLSLSLSRRSAACERAGLCHIHSPLFNNSSVLLCILEHASLHCTVCLQTARRRQKEKGREEGRKKKKKKESCLHFSSLPPAPAAPTQVSQPQLQHVTLASRQPLIPILSSSGSRTEHLTSLATPSPPSTCMGSGELPLSGSGRADSLRAVSRDR